jgi:hypothetical protein
MSELTEDQKKLHAAAIAEGYKDETCAKCGLECLAFHHFIRCDERPCPMLGGNPKSLLDMWAEAHPLPVNNTQIGGAK